MKIDSITEKQKQYVLKVNKLENELYFSQDLSPVTSINKVFI